MNGYLPQTHVSVTVSSGSAVLDLPDDSGAKEGYPNSWSLKEVERAHIQQLVDYHDGNKSAASRDLGVARKTLERKFKEWEMAESNYAE